MRRTLQGVRDIRDIWVQTGSALAILARRRHTAPLPTHVGMMDGVPDVGSTDCKGKVDTISQRSVNAECAFISKETIQSNASQVHLCHTTRGRCACRRAFPGQVECMEKGTTASNTGMPALATTSLRQPAAGTRIHAPLAPPPPPVATRRVLLLCALEGPVRQVSAGSGNQQDGADEGGRPGGIVELVPRRHVACRGAQD